MCACGFCSTGCSRSDFHALILQSQLILFNWRYKRLNPRPSTCKSGTVPLSYDTALQQMGLLTGYGFANNLPLFSVLGLSCLCNCHRFLHALQSETNFYYILPSRLWTSLQTAVENQVCALSVNSTALYSALHYICLCHIQ